jgi:hypothetical protein
MTSVNVEAIAIVRRPPRASTLPLKMWGIGTPRWQLLQKGTLSYDHPKGMSGRATMSASGPSRRFAASVIRPKLRVKRTRQTRRVSDAIDPYVWSGRVSQEVLSSCRVAVLHQCIRPLIGASVLPAIMDISAPAISLADRPRWAIWVTSARMRREDRSSISSHPLADLGGSLTPLVITRLEACSSRRLDHEQERSMQCVPVCWQARWRARCGAAAFWRPRSTA